MIGEDPAPLFADKRTDKTVAAQVTVQHGATRGKRGLKVDEIKDKAAWFGMQLLAGKLLRNQRPNEVSAGCIRAAAKCAMGVTMSWAHFLVEEFRVDFLEARERKIPFHYSWLLILIALVGWGELTNSSFVPPIPECCETVCYASLWISLSENENKILIYALLSTI